MHSHIKQKHDVIDSFAQSKDCYKVYLAEGKKFKDAQKLKKANQQLIISLSNVQANVSPEIKKAIDDVVQHIEIWRSLWDAHYLKRQPKPDDEFVFENQHRFPFASEHIIIEYLSSINFG